MLIVKMSLKNVLMNYVLNKNVMKYLDVDSKKNLSEVNKDFNEIMKDTNYFEGLYFKCNNLDNYMKSLELLQDHSRTLKRIIVDNQIDIFTYLPQNIEDKYEIIIENCRVYITNKIKNRISKMLLKNCYVRDKYPYYKWVVNN
jgi:hypothetical protein